MRAFLALLLLLSAAAHGQQVKVMVPEQPVVVGTAFQVQYIATHPAAFVAAGTPQFTNCEVVSGPKIYSGHAVINGVSQPIKNIAYTLVPKQTGRLTIAPITVYYNNTPDVTSPPAAITVAPQPGASYKASYAYTDASLYAPPPGENFTTILNNNLFVKTLVDKTTCYTGQPLTATFVLYSRLQSVSEAQRSPAFYGFSVVDILDTREAHTAVQQVNGKIYNTAVLRKVQLYPAQAGQLVIDEMYVHNEIEFDDTVHHTTKKVEKDLMTKPVIIRVKPLPQNQPADFGGAVGRFSIAARLDDSNIATNNQGRLLVTVSGTGNFLQFTPPQVFWPKGIDAFEPEITNKLNYGAVPMQGQRTYTYLFSVSALGNDTIPPIGFSFFDPQLEVYKKAVTKPLAFTVTAPVSKAALITPIKKKQSYKPWWAVAAAALTLAVVLAVWKQIKKSPKNVLVPTRLQPTHVERIAVLNAGVMDASHLGVVVQNIVQEFFSENESALSRQQKTTVKEILAACQILIYTPANTTTEKELLIKKTLALLKGFSETG